MYKFLKGPMVRSLLLIVGFSLLPSLQGNALDLKPSEIRGKQRRKPVSVLQNRFFLKSMRPEVGVVMGTFLNEAYTETSAIGVRGGMFFTEWLGFEVQYLTTSVEDSADRKALSTLQYRPIDTTDDSERVSPSPETNAILGSVDFNVVAAPFYGKLNLMNKMIVYSDLYMTAGYSSVNTEQGNLGALTLSAGQRFYLMKNLSVRVDFRDRIYTEQRGGQDSRKNALSVDFGASYFFR